MRRVCSLYIVALEGTRSELPRHLLPVLAVSFLFPTFSPGQTPETRDSLPEYSLDAIVVTADRFENRIATTSSSVSMLRAADIDRLPFQNLSEALQFGVPGFYSLQTDGVGREPALNARGFYGGGEAEYLVLLVDGHPVNDLETGRINWNLLSLHDISSIEISRGAASPLYGDAALGGVINVRTKQEPRPHSSLFLRGGSYNQLSAGGRHGGTVGTGFYALSGATERGAGFRRHSAWSGTNVRSALSLPTGDRSLLNVSTAHSWSSLEDPGALPEHLLPAGRTASTPYYAWDGRDEERHQLHLDYMIHVSGRSDVTAGFLYHRRNGSSVRTFLSPSLDGTFQPRFDTTLYGDTKERAFHTDEVRGTLSFRHSSSLASLPNRFIAGAEASRGSLESEYVEFFGGFEEDYAGAYPSQGGQGATIADGTGTRKKFAFFLHDEIHLTGPLVVSFGARYDLIKDTYAGVLPDTSIHADRSAFSPKVGVNLLLLDAESYTVNVYGAFNRSFKAATQDQLADRRTVTTLVFAAPGVAFPYSAAPFSNGLLRPQKGTTFEAGTYQRITLAENVSAEVTLSVYTMEMTDEIDFNLATFRYENISESRHRGIESGVKMYLHPSITAFANVTYTDVRFTSGVRENNFAKAIPRTTVTLGATADLASDVQGSLVWNFMSDMYLDDENTVGLPDYNAGTLRLSYTLPPVTLVMDVENLLDRTYESTGYVYYGQTYLSPAAGRMVRGGITINL